MTANRSGQPGVGATVLEDDGRPDALAAGSPVEFVAAMRQLKSWSGLSYRQLERQATLSGRTLPRSTAVAMLNRDRLPREELVVAFVHACGCTADQVARWVVARRRLAVRTGTAEVTRAAPVTGVPQVPATNRGQVRPVPVPAMVVAAVLILLATATASWLAWA